MIHKNVINEVIINEWLLLLHKLIALGLGLGGGGGISLNLTHLPMNCP